MSARTPHLSPLFIRNSSPAKPGDRNIPSLISASAVVTGVFFAHSAIYGRRDRRRAQRKASFGKNFDGQLRCRSHCSTVALHQRENFPFKCGGARLGVGGRPRVGVANSSHLPAARRRRRTFAHPALLYEFHNGFDHRVPIHLFRSKRGVCFPPKQPLPDLLRGGKQYRSSSRGPAPPPPPSSSSGGKERGGKEDGKERWICIVFLLTTPAPPRCSAVAAR